MRALFKSFLILIIVTSALFTLKAPAFADFVAGGELKTVPLYRLHNGGLHNYTTNLSEYVNLLANGYTFESYEGHISPVPLPGLVPLYKLTYRDADCFLTTREYDKRRAEELGFIYSGILGYVEDFYGDSMYGTVPLYRFFHPQTNPGDGFVLFDQDHFYKVDAYPVDFYNYEGICCKLWKQETSISSIALISPNGGEKLYCGSPFEIKWNCSVLGGKVDLFFSRSDGYPSEFIATVNNTGSYDWVVPNIITDNAKIRVQYHGDEPEWETVYLEDISDSTFSIKFKTTDIIKKLSPVIGIPEGLELNETSKVFGPKAPQLTASSDSKGSSATLCWTEATENVDGFKIERSNDNVHFSEIASVAGNVFNYKNEDVLNNTRYYYRVKAVLGDLKSNYSNVAAITVSRKITLVQKQEIIKIIEDIRALYPSKPQNLSCEVSDNTTDIKLSWDAGKGIVTGYKVERKNGDSEPWKQIGTTENDERSYVDKNLDYDKKYIYRVRAYNPLGDSEFSEQEDITIEREAEEDQTQSDKKDETEICFYLNKKAYTVNGVKKNMDSAPAMVGGRILIPIRYAAEPLGAEIKWIEAEKKITIELGNDRIELWIGKNEAKVNGLTKKIDSNNPEVMPVAVNGRTVLPLRFIAESLNCSVDWDAELERAVLVYKIIPAH